MLFVIIIANLFFNNLYAGPSNFDENVFKFRSKYDDVCIAKKDHASDGTVSRLGLMRGSEKDYWQSLTELAREDYSLSEAEVVAKAEQNEQEKRKLFFAQNAIEMARILDRHPSFVYEPIETALESESTPLHYVTQHGSANLLEKILHKNHQKKFKVDSFLSDQHGYTAFDYAVKLKDIDKINVLFYENLRFRRFVFDVAYQEDVRLLVLGSIQDLDLSNLLRKAIRFHHPSVVELLCRFNVDVNVKYSGDSTPLHKAVSSSFSHIKIIESLVKQGANLNAVNNRGNTPLHNAAVYARIDIIKLLIELGADTTIKNSRTGILPLDLALIFAVRPRTTLADIQYLVKNGANPLIEDFSGRTALDYARGFGLQDIVEYLESLTTTAGIAQAARSSENS